MKRPRYDETTSAFRNFVKAASYNLGFLGGYHRFRNKTNLTTVMFHRVLPQASAAWCTADWRYTLSADIFTKCLEFFRCHYSVISLEQLIAAATTRARLPPRPLLITFDDGWADTLEYAAPVLEKLKMPAVCFVASDPIDDPAPRWWQEAFDCEWRAHRIDEQTIHAAWNKLQHDPLQTDPAWNVNAYLTCLMMLQDLPQKIRDDILNQHSDVALRQTPRQMLDTAGVTALPMLGVAVGAHGASHLPLVMCRDADSELKRARSRLEVLLADTKQPTVATMSFPHGRYTADTVRAVRAAGYKLIFSSAPHLSPLFKGLPVNDLHGRIEISSSNITNAVGDFAPERLATHLFSRAVG